MGSVLQFSQIFCPGVNLPWYNSILTVYVWSSGSPGYLVAFVLCLVNTVFKLCSLQLRELTTNCPWKCIPTEWKMKRRKQIPLKSFKRWEKLTLSCPAKRRKPFTMKQVHIDLSLCPHTISLKILKWEFSNLLETKQFEILKLDRGRGSARNMKSARPPFVVVFP